MNDRTLKLSVIGIAIVAFMAAICAVVFFSGLVIGSSLLGGDRVALGRLSSTVEPAALPSNNLQSAPQIVPTATTTVTLAVAVPKLTATPPPLEAITIVTHVVQSGENLYRISLAYGVSVEDIMLTNGIIESRFITAGQVLKIPVSEATVAGQGGSQAAGLAVATATPEPFPPTPTGTPLPRIGVNGLSLDSIVVMSESVLQNVRQIYANGQALGRNSHAYSRLGDSTIENPHFMARFDEGPYVLGEYAYLQPVIDYFAGSHARQGVAVRRGFHSWTVTDPLWADKSQCLPNENSVQCEIRLNNPSIMLIRLGSNDSGVPAGFEQNMRLVLDTVIQSGVIPILGTKADRFEGSNINNDIIRRLADEYQVPLWDFDLVAGTIPGRGLDVDNVHLTTFYAHDYTSPTAFQRGHSMHNLTALMALDAVLREVIWESE